MVLWQCGAARAVAQQRNSCRRLPGVDSGPKEQKCTTSIVHRTHNDPGESPPPANIRTVKTTGNRRMNSARNHSPLLLDHQWMGAHECRDESSLVPCCYTSLIKKLHRCQRRAWLVAHVGFFGPVAARVARVSLYPRSFFALTYAYKHTFASFPPGAACHRRDWASGNRSHNSRTYLVHCVSGLPLGSRQSPPIINPKAWHKTYPSALHPDPDLSNRFDTASAGPGPPLSSTCKADPEAAGVPSPDNQSRHRTIKL